MKKLTKTRTTKLATKKWQWLANHSNSIEKTAAIHLLTLLIKRNSELIRKSLLQTR